MKDIIFKTLFFNFQLLISKLDVLLKTLNNNNNNSNNSKLGVLLKTLNNNR